MAKEEQATVKDSGGTDGRVIALAAWCLSLALFWIELGGRSFFSDLPLYQDNYPKYFYLTDTAARLVRETGSFWGYDPTFAAGYITNPFGGMVANQLLVVVAAAAGWPAVVVLKALLAAFFLMFPWLIYGTCRRFGLTRVEAGAAMILDVALNFASVRYRAIHASMGTYYTATPLLFAAMGVLAKNTSDRPRPYRTMGIVTFLGTLLAYWHVQQAMLLALASSVHVAHRRSVYFQSRAWPSLFVPVVGIPLFCWPWLSSLIRVHIETRPFHMDVIRFLGLSWHGSGAWLFSLGTLAQPVYLVTATAAVFGWRLFKGQAPPEMRFLRDVLLIIVLAVLILHVSPGGFLLFPTRFLDVLPIGVMTIAASGLRTWREGRRSRNRLLAGGIVVTAAVTFAVAPIIGLNPSFQTKTPEGYKKLVKWIEDNTTNDARVAVEGSGKRDGQPLGFDPPALLPSDVPRSYFSLPSTESGNPLYLGFMYEGHIGTHEIRALDDASLGRLLDLYNIGWIVTANADTIAALEERLALFESVAAPDPYRAFAARRAPNWFVEGSGTVLAAMNRIDLTSLTPGPNGRVVLAFHHFASLTLDGSGDLKRFDSDLDPIGFISLTGSGYSASIRNDSRRGLPSWPASYKFDFKDSSSGPRAGL